MRIIIKQILIIKARTANINVFVLNVLFSSELSFLDIFDNIMIAIIDGIIPMPKKLKINENTDTM